MEPSDVIAATGVGFALVAVGVAGWGLVYAKRASKAAADSAAYGERSAVAAERAATAAEALVPPTPPLVIWQLTPAGKRRDTYRLLNVGEQRATGVTVRLMPSETSTSFVEPAGSVVDAGGVTSFSVVAVSMGLPPATHLYY